MTLGEGTGILGFIRSWRNDRPNVKIIPRLRDYGPVRAGIMTTRIGLYLDIEIHSTGAQPVHVLDVGMQLSDYEMVPLGRINRTLTRPEFETIYRPLDDVRTVVGKRVVVRFYATATPDREFTQGLSGDWRGFPVQLPPSEPGRDHGAFFVSRR